MVPAVLHVTSAAGGGADRYMRDVAASVPGRHFTLHVGAHVDVFEDVGARRFVPVAAGEARALQHFATHVDLVHVHGVDVHCRARMQALLRVNALPFAATLHDLGFLHPDLFAPTRASSPGAPDRRWTDEVLGMLRRADAVLAPSAYIAGEVARHMPEVAVTLVAPGLAAQRASSVDLPEAFVARRRTHVVAVIGAIGPHKGSALLADLAAGLQKLDADLVVIGYTDASLTQGWHAPGLFVHGPYRDDMLANWLAAYAPAVALFPNRIPESFSYTLSEAWAAGLPAVVPDEGALGERVRAHGGGWLLPAHYGPTDALALLGRILAEPEELARVKSRIVSADADRVPSLASMSAAVAAVYARFDVSGHAPSLETLQPLLAANLDGFAFRQEIVRLCEALATAQADVDTLRAWNVRVENDIAEAKRWIAKLEDDVASLKAAVEARDESVRALTAEVQRRAANQAAFERLPRLIQRVLAHRMHRAGR